MFAGSLLMLVFGPSLVVPGICDAWAGEPCFGLALAVPLFAAHVAFLWKFSGMTSLWRRMRRFGPFARSFSVAVLSVLSAAGVWFELPCIERYGVPVCGGKMQGGSSIRFAVVTDLHSCLYGRNQQSLVDAVRRVRPDAVLLSGDIADDRMDDANAKTAVRRLAEEFVCLYVTGNHEYWSERVDEIKAWMREAGAIVLDGEVRTLEIKGTVIDFCGVDDPTYIMDYWLVQLAEVDAASDPARLRILLSHRPEYAEIYAQCGFDLVVSGHLHGGQWRLPWLDVGICGPASCDRRFFPRYSSGVYALNERTWLAVSRGLARESTPLPRFFNHPELMVVDLNPQ